MKKCKHCDINLDNSNSTKNRGRICKKCLRSYNREYARKRYANKSENIKQNSRNHRKKLKLEVFSYYSPDLRCQRCGFDDIRALSIDHIFGFGNQHRKTIGKTPGVEFYRWIRDNHFPNDFQVLCMNCQVIKRHENKEYAKKLQPID